MESRVLDLEKRVAELERKVETLIAGQGLPSVNDMADIKRHDAGEYSIKVIYPGIYHHLDEPLRAGFPKNRRSLARRVAKGSHMFIYVTSPEKWIIGMAEVTGPAEADLGANPKWPYVVPLRWEIGPKAIGVKFSDVGIDIRPRIGDTLYALGTDKAEEIKALLRQKPDLTAQDVARLRMLYSHIE